MEVQESVNKKFEVAKALFEKDSIKEFKNLFDVAPYTLVARKININNVRFKAKMEEPMSLKLSELQEVAELLNIDPLALCALVLKSQPKSNS